VTRASIAIALVAVSCGKGDRGGDTDRDHNTTAPRVATTPDAAPDARAPAVLDDSVDNCVVEDVELIYTVDDKGHLASFDPRKLPDDPFHEVGTLACDSDTTPFSMAVDRKGIAWVLYNDGAVFRASIHNAACSSAIYRNGPSAPKTFGMGFVSDGVDAKAETLYVAADDDSHVLARLDRSNGGVPRWTPIARQTVGERNPELTGTADGSLYGYFPDSDGRFIQQIDRKTGARIGKRLELGTTRDVVDAWAFAHWGGKFYVFSTVDGNSMVDVIDRKTGEHDTVLERLPNRIVGAGVSTCAPLLERPTTVEKPAR
jgi:hypothetical protein